MNNSVVIDKKFYWELFKSTFLISAFTVGGGFVIIPLLKAKYVDHYKWMSDKEALDLVSVAQSALWSGGRQCRYHYRLSSGRVYRRCSYFAGYSDAAADHTDGDFVFL